MTILTLDGVSKHFQSDGRSISPVSERSLTLSAGQWLGLHGPSGCGKTTTLFIAGGLMRPSAGSVRIADTDIYDLSGDQRARLRAERIGFLFQRFHLSPALTVRDNVALAQITGSDQGRERADELLERFGLTERAGHKPHQLSVGEQQRVALARALFPRPDILLADEPTGNLDQANAVIVLDAFAQFAEDGGAVMMVSHDAAALERCEDQLSLA
ncbi:MAG: ABC transporter ATP-binding protein [Lentisphaeria bacterium]|nr:ABC transporter ATP-binding protein [Lentisphaeria bacterium]NQZ68135.1 ABC transporter ATP-binding protein [Lentisphaeria bacterium]